jgi:predicted dehydrogenase
MAAELIGDRSGTMKILIIGCGLIGELHAQTIQREGGHVLVLAEPKPELLSATAALVHPAATYTDYRKALESEHLDAVFVCTPNALHAEHTIAALQHGCHVLCEKPMALKWEEARAMCAAAQEARKTLMVGYGMRVNACVNRIRDVLTSGELGKPIAARVVLAKPETLTEAKTTYRRCYETGGGILYDYSHELDYCGLFFGKAQRCACWKRLAACSPKDTCDDCADFVIQYESGLCAVCHFDYIQAYGQGRGRWIGITFERGFLETDFVTELKTWHNNGDMTLFHPYLPDRWWGLKEQFDLFCDVVAHRPNDRYVWATGESAAEVVALVEALYRAADRGEIVAC